MPTGEEGALITRTPKHTFYRQKKPAEAGFWYCYETELFDRD
jgi:hypothetical protein